MSGDAFSPGLTTTDWNAEWMQLQMARRRADSAEYWNQKSAHFGSKDAPSNYVTEFLHMVDLQPGESVFDMGCGNGALALPFARAGHPVLACDFSTGMLGRLEADRDAQGLTDLITTRLVSWDEDWTAAGIAPKSADVAVASRSIATANLKDSLMRLNDVARRQVCLTLTTGSSPRSDERMLTALGLQNQIGRDYLYAFNILAQEGLSPSVRYIHSAREDVYDTPQEAFESLGRMVEDVTVALDAEERAEALDRLATWLIDDLVKFDDPETGTTRYRLSKPRVIHWAFISWDAQ